MEEPSGGHYHYVNGEAIFHAGAHDLHAWQSVENARIYVASIADAFCSADTEGCPVYEANAALNQRSVARRTTEPAVLACCGANCRALSDSGSRKQTLRSVTPEPPTP